MLPLQQLRAGQAAPGDVAHEYRTDPDPPLPQPPVLRPEPELLHHARRHRGDGPSGADDRGAGHPHGRGPDAADLDPDPAGAPPGEDRAVPGGAAPGAPAGERPGDGFVGRLPAAGAGGRGRTAKAAVADEPGRPGCRRSCRAGWPRRPWRTPRTTWRRGSRRSRSGSRGWRPVRLRPNVRHPASPAPSIASSSGSATSRFTVPRAERGQTSAALLTGPIPIQGRRRGTNIAPPSPRRTPGAIKNPSRVRLHTPGPP